MKWKISAVESLLVRVENRLYFLYFPEPYQLLNFYFNSKTDEIVCHNTETVAEDAFPLNSTSLKYLKDYRTGIAFYHNHGNCGAVAWAGSASAILEEIPILHRTLPMVMIFKK